MTFEINGTDTQIEGGGEVFFVVVTQDEGLGGKGFEKIEGELVGFGAGLVLCKHIGREQEVNAVEKVS